MLEHSTASLAYILVPVRARSAGAAYNPTGDTVSMAFTAAAATPAAGDWKTASWETDTGPTPDVYYARCLVGPGGAVTLTAATYTVWVKIADNPETPVLRAGLVRVS